MIFKRTRSAVSNQRGFTLIELLMVIGILATLASIAAKSLTVNRQRSYDSQTIAIMKTLLTVSAIDEPRPDPAVTGEATDDPINPVTIGGVGGNLADLGPEFASVNVPRNISWTIINDGNSNSDLWMFYLAHPAGDNGYYFWIPGSACDTDVDTGGNGSDRIYWENDKAAGSYRNIAGLPAI